MAKQFDVAVKHLLDAYPADWLDLIGLRPEGPVEAFDPDLSTLSAQADKVLRLNGRQPSLLSLELQASYDSTLGQRVLKYSVLLDSRYDLPVRSVVVLLRPEADGREMSGRLERSLPESGRYLEFCFNVVRLWRLPLESLLERGLGILPLAPLADIPAAALPGVVARMHDRLDHEADRAESATLWTATFVLMGLKYERELAGKLLQGVRAMKESVTYQQILEEGEARGEARGEVRGEARGTLNSILRVGSKRFGEPPAPIRAALARIDDVGRLQTFLDRLLEISCWDELLNER